MPTACPARRFAGSGCIVNDTGFLYTNIEVLLRMKSSAQIAQGFVSARLAGAALPGFPGTIPDSLAVAYACQDAAIALWPDEVAGWKVGRIVAPWLARFATERLVGPIFRRAVQHARPGETLIMPVFEGGFAAVEAEFVFRLRAAAPAGKTQWTEDEAAALVEAMHVGIESAGSPLAPINDLGPAVVVADFGNNAGLMVGPAIPDWRRRALDSLASETLVNGSSVGSGSAASVPGGPLAALVFTLTRCAERGLPLQAGHYVSTGATTGIHAVRPGDSAQVIFRDIGELQCLAVPAKPSEERARTGSGA
jgi:2-keto-4-pentenoate hydratase